jgi:hypothetical protein
MEHRWSVRRQIDGDVVLTLSLPPQERIVAKLRNISVGGISIISDNLELPADTVVTLAFSLDNAGQVSYHRLPGQVVYCEKQRSGLIFINPTTETLRVLRQLGSVAHDDPLHFVAGELRTSA